jgi:outer membrane protein assembly factor BamB
MYVRATMVLLLFVCACSVRAEDWREFRGPTGQGLYDGKNLPLEWSTTKNVAWKTPIAGHGWSSPIVLDGRVYLTTAVPIPETKDISLSALCVDAANGKILWQKEVFLQDGKAPKIHGKNSHASPTPLTDGKRLYVHFGHQGAACLDLDGSIVWKNTEHKYAPVHGNGGTPILADNKIVFSADGGNTQNVIALDKTTGKTAWKTPRKVTASKKFSFSTPLLIDVKGKPQIISPGPGAVIAYDPKDGHEIWRANYGEGYSVIPRPVYGHGMIFISSGYDSPVVYAIKVDGQGDVTTTHVAWKITKGAPHAPSMLLVGDELYAVSDRGLASCLDAKTGKVHWQQNVGRAFSASPSFADGKIYFQSEEGKTTVVRAAKKFEVLATSEVGERTFASYAFADGAIYLRTETLLYRIQSK